MMLLTGGFPAAAGVVGSRAGMLFTMLRLMLLLLLLLLLLMIWVLVIVG
jgi:hypothetical protein